MRRSPARTPTVSAVIPSLGRDLLHQAVESALAQTRAPDEIIIVFDLPEPPPNCVIPSGVRVEFTGGGKGPNAARQLGIGRATGDSIALLDDDDFWYPEKLERQTALLAPIRARGKLGVITAGTDIVDYDGTLRYTATRFMEPSQTIPDYLFKRRHFRGVAGGGFGPSSLLVDRRLFELEPLDAQLRIHEDWDWLLRAAARPDVECDSVRASMLAYRLSAPGARIGSSAYWRRSVEWADQRRGDQLSTREYADFLLSVSAALAVEAGNRRGAAQVIARALRHGRPGVHSMVVGLGFLCMPRQSQNRVWTWLDRTAAVLARRPAQAGH
jgi:hypothetical protein